MKVRMHKVSINTTTMKTTTRVDENASRTAWASQSKSKTDLCCLVSLLLGHD